MLDVGREINKAFIDAATNVSATLDGQALQVTRLVSEEFDATVPADKGPVSRDVCFVKPDHNRLRQRDNPFARSGQPTSAWSVKRRPCSWTEPRDSHCKAVEIAQGR